EFLFSFHLENANKSEQPHQKNFLSLEKIRHLKSDNQSKHHFSLPIAALFFFRFHSDRKPLLPSQVWRHKLHFALRLPLQTKFFPYPVRSVFLLDTHWAEFHTRIPPDCNARPKNI